MQLPVRFPPSPEHSWSGYLLQLAQKNGLRDLDSLLSELGMNKRTPKDGRNWSSELLDALIPRLASALDMPEMAFWKLVEQHHAKAWLDVVPGIGDLRLATPRVCLKCLSERNGNHDWRWQLPTFSSCALHQTALHSHCPCCGHSFVWRSELLIRCPKCKVSWHTVENAVVTKTRLEAHLWDSIDETDSKIIPLLREVLHATLALARPFDALRQKLQVWPLCAEQSQLTNNAYQLLTQPKFVREWEVACRHERQDLVELSESAVLAPVNQWQAKQRTVIAESFIDESQVVPAFREYSEFFKPCRAKTLKSKKDNLARYQVDKEQLANFVHLQARDLLPLIRNEVLKPLNDNTLPYNQLFDVRELLLVKNVVFKKHANQTLKLSPNSAILRKHLVKYGELLLALSLGHVQGSAVSLSNWSSMFVSEDGFDNWLKRQFYMRCLGLISLPDAACSLAVGPNTVKAWLKQGRMSYSRKTRNTDKIEGQSLWKFWCKHYGVNPRLYDFSSVA